MQNARRLCPFVAILAVMSMLLSTQASHAATFYVATYGDDANAGTEELPFQTIQRGAWALSAGDTLIVRGGTYLESLYYASLRDLLEPTSDGAGSPWRDGSPPSHCAD